MNFANILILETNYIIYHRIAKDSNDQTTLIARVKGNKILLTHYSQYYTVTFVFMLIKLKFHDFSDYETHLL